MKFTAIGISHKTCPIEIRERFYLNQLERELLLSELKNLPEISESLVISTCNRTEIYAMVLTGHERLLAQKLCAVKKQAFTKEVEQYFYYYSNEAAVWHFLSVASGLDSLVVGEKEILGQIKDAIELARRKKYLGRFLNILTNMALRTGRLARSSTAISQGGLSVSWAAVELAKKRLETLSGRSIMIVGAGKMSYLAAADLKRKGLEKLYIINRTKEKGELLAQKFNGIATDFSDIRKLLGTVDVCICSASAPHYLLEKDLIQECVMTRTSELLLIDISMPRNIDPSCSRIKGVNLISLDELDEVVASSVTQRQNAVIEVKKIISKKMNEFYGKLGTSPQGFQAELTTQMLTGSPMAG